MLLCFMCCAEAKASLTPLINHRKPFPHPQDIKPTGWCCIGDPFQSHRAGRAPRCHTDAIHATPRRLLRDGCSEIFVTACSTHGPSRHFAIHPRWPRSITPIAVRFVPVGFRCIGGMIRGLSSKVGIEAPVNLFIRSRIVNLSLLHRERLITGRCCLGWRHFW
jgi:hypothetical protein